MDAANVTDRITGFLESIGVPCRPGVLPGETFLPGILIANGAVTYDPDRLTYPGDLLHEAGHLAIMSPERRARAKPNVGKYAAEEMAAIAWSYAAVVHLGLDPSVVFHENGYRGESAALIGMFARQPAVPVGVPILQWLGMTKDYPAMIRWLNDGSNAAAADAFK